VKIYTLLLPIFLYCESFINKFEYGEMLYNNPRGISCSKCHGEHGEGRVLATYIHKKKVNQVVAPMIVNLSFGEMKKSLNYTRNFFMPKYYLTDSEIDAITTFLKSGVKR